jgi:hypothetical protein
MRSTILTLLLIFPSVFFAQQKSDTTAEKKKTLPYYIETCIDKMTDKPNANGSKYLMCTDGKEKAFAVSFIWTYNGEEVSYFGINVFSQGIGNCVENSKLFLLFEDDTKLQLTAWNEFNCDGSSFMDWKGKQFDKIVSQKVKTIRFQNGRTYDSFTYDLSPDEQSFFMEAGNAFYGKRIVSGRCSD